MVKIKLSEIGIYIENSYFPLDVLKKSNKLYIFGKECFTAQYLVKLSSFLLCSDCMYSQNNISNVFRCGIPLEDSIKDIKHGWTPEIMVTKKEGDDFYYTLDNRRLYCAKKAGSKSINVKFVHYCKYTMKRKFTTRNNGKSIYVRRNKQY